MRSLSKASIFIFFVQPFIGFVLACCNLKSKANCLVFVLFYGLFGYAHSFADKRSDSFRKLVDFISFPPSTTFTDVLKEYIDGERLDVFEGFLFVFVKQFTNDAHVVLMLVGLMGGFFYMLLIRRVLRFNHYMVLPVVLFILIITVCSPVSIGGIRNFVAASIFSFSTWMILIEKRNLFFLLLCVCPFIHFGLILSVAAVVIVKFVPLPNSALFWGAVIMCIASAFMDTSMFGDVMGRASQLSGNQAVMSRSSVYSNEDTQAEFDASLTTQLTKVGGYFTRAFVLILLFYCRKRIKKNPNSGLDLQFYHYVLFFLFFGYSLSAFSVVGGRYLVVGFLLMHVFFNGLFYANWQDRYLRRMKLLLPACFAISILWSLFNCYFVTRHNLYYQLLPIVIAGE